MQVPDGLLQALQPWADLHANSLVVSVGLTFVHLAGLMVGGGAAIATDWETLRATTPSTRLAAAARMLSQHGTIRTALLMVVVSGAGLATADLEVFAASTVFLAKMSLVALLMANGMFLQRAAGRAAHDPERWAPLAASSSFSLFAWLALMLAGTLLEVAA